MTRDPRAALIAWRASTGYSQTEVGALFDVSKQGVGNWEQGRARVPRRVQAQLRAEGWLHQARQARPALHHDPLCLTGCQSCTVRRTWAAGKYARTQHFSALRHWTPEQDARLHTLAGHYTAAEIADRLATEFGVRRTPVAINTRLGRAGYPCGIAAFTERATAQLCGVTARTVQRWIRAGVLTAEQLTAKPRGHWVIRPTALEQFLRDARHLFRWEDMPSSRWRELARTLAQRDPLYSLKQASALYHVSYARLAQAIHTGALPYVWGSLAKHRTKCIARSALMRWVRQCDRWSA